MPEYSDSQRSFERTGEETQTQADSRAATASTLSRYGNRINLRGALRNAYIEPPITNPGEQGPKQLGTVRDSSFFSDQPRLFPGLKALSLDKKSVLPKQKKKKKEKIISEKRALTKIKNQDYRARIVEVLDSNRVRVNQTYEDGVNITKHKGDDQRAETFKYWRVNYQKANIERFKTFMVCDNDYYLITNDRLNADEKSRVVKLKQPLLENKNELDKVYFVEKRLPDYEEKVRLVPFVERPDEGIFLRIPNLNSVDNPINFQGTNFKNQNDLLGSDTQLNFELQEKLTSGSLLDIQPNIDYQKTTTNLLFELDDTGFGNYINFSSAERRLTNFKRKLELIESHTKLSQSLVSVSSSLSTIREEENKRQRVVNSFDPFEHYMYFESSSFVSSSLGLFHDTSWPKTNSSEPFVLAHTTSSQATTWYNNMILSASTYDQNNVNSLRNTLPEHVYSDTQNNVFLEFMDMVGQQFDEIWTYVKSITDVNKKVEKVSEGISKDVTLEFAKALGLELYLGNDLVDLPEFLLGKNADGTTKNTKSSEDISEEIWKRILANLPFFIKAKGTERAVKGLLSCYGIPSSILRVREYGGPDKGTRVSHEIKRKFTRALDFKGSQFIKVPWKNDTNGEVPQTIEFRYRTPYKANQVLFKKAAGFAIQLINSGSTEYGNVRFAVSSSGTGVSHLDTPKLKLFNDDMWSVMLTRVSSSGEQLVDNSASRSVDYEITAKQYDSTRQKILFEGSSSLTVDGASALSASYNQRVTNNSHDSVFIAGNGNNWGSQQFSGSMMEFRYWSEPLSASVFDNHVRTPKAYNGNTSASSYDDLLLRLPLDDNKNLQTNPTASNLAYIKTYQGNISGSNIDGFTGNFFRTVVDQEKLKVPNVGPNRRNATKIRIEDNTLKTGTALSPEVRNEVSSQDFAPIDSNKLGIYFSPVDVVNEDIVYSLADLSLDDLIGDPRDEFKYSYKTLGSLQREYFKRYTQSNNFFDYLRILKFYDSSVFTQVRQLLPARADSTLGVLIEPNILERSKEVLGKQPEFDNRIFANAQDFDDGVMVTRTNLENKESNFSTANSSYDTYEGALNLAITSGSDLGFLNTPSKLRVLGENDRRLGFGTTYLNASGEVSLKNFTDALVPIISGSRLSETKEIEELFFPNALSASLANYAPNPKFYANSSSFKAADVESIAESNNLFRSFYQGTKNTRETTFDKKEPIEVLIVSPTKIVTQDSDISKLKTK
tara:strand:- start:2866 stop:6549 length:3684 start_codon:yes stop_codon:yes gene_type:complete